MLITILAILCQSFLLCTHLRTPVHTHAYLSTPAHTHAHMHTPHTYPLMPADALDLINHMKLHVKGKMEERKKDGKKKEGTRVH